MNASQTTFLEHGVGRTQTDKFITCLMEANGEWVSLLILVGAGCGFACHSRASDGRRKGYNIENKVVYNDQLKTRESFYRIIP